MSQVKVTTNAEGQIICGLKQSLKDGKNYGYIRVESKTSTMKNGWVNEQKLSALIRGEQSMLESFVQANHMRAGSTLSGRIRVVESTTPSYEGHEPKRAGEDGPVLKVGGQPIYRNTEYVEADNTEPNVLLQHDTITVSTGAAITPNARVN